MNIKNKTLIVELNLLFEQATRSCSTNISKLILKTIYEWSVGDLGNDINFNITDKISLKSIKKDDILVINKTSIYPMAKEQDKGDVQLTVESIDGTKLSCVAVGGDKVELDLLDLRILEAYSRIKESNKIFVVDLPVKINKDKFAESKDNTNRVKKNFII